MADEEKTEEETQEPADAGSDPVPEGAPDAPSDEGSDPSSGDAAPESDEGSDPSSDDAAADAPAEEDAPAEASGDAPPDAPAAGSDDDAEGPPTQKQLRKLERSKHTGEARPPRTPEERAAERAERRGVAAANRRRYRSSQRSKRGEPGQGTPPAERVAGTRKVRQGRVVSAKADKTITVRIDVVRRHPQYEKVVRRSATLHAHDAQNEANEGDTVRVVETRPLSRTKRWRLVEVVEKAR